MGVLIILHGGGGRNWFCPLGVVITRHRVVECLVSVSNCVIYILPLLLSSKYDDIVVSCCGQHHFYMYIFLVARWGGRPTPPPLPKYAHAYLILRFVVIVPLSSTYIVGLSLRTYVGCDGRVSSVPQQSLHNVGMLLHHGHVERRVAVLKAHTRPTSTAVLKMSY